MSQEMGDEHYLEEIRRRYGVPASIGTRVMATIGLLSRRGTIVGAKNDIQVRVRLDGAATILSFTPSDLFYL